MSRSRLYSPEEVAQLVRRGVLECLEDKTLPWAINDQSGLLGIDSRDLLLWLKEQERKRGTPQED